MKTLNELEEAWRGSQPDTTKLKLPGRIPLDALEVLPELFQPRKEDTEGRRPSPKDRTEGVVFREHVAKLAAHLSEPGRDLDPILVLPVGDRNIVIDGHHRRDAYRHKERQDIPVRWFSGSPKAAYIEAGRQNFKDVAQSSEATKSQRAWEMVLSGDLWTREQVMAGSSASRTTVGNMRRVLAEYKKRGEEPHELWVNARRGLLEDRDSGDDEQSLRVSQNVTEWTKRLREHFPKLDTLGKAHMFAEAVQKLSPRRAEDIALWLVDELGLYEVVAERYELIQREMKDAYNF